MLANLEIRFFFSGICIYYFLKNILINLLLSNLDKIVEKLMCRRSMEFLNEQKSLYCKQYGFCNGFLTVHAIINVSDNIESAINTKQFVYGVFIDLQKAFDTVDHNILLEKIQHLVSEE